MAPVRPMRPVRPVMYLVIPKNFAFVLVGFRSVVGLNPHITSRPKAAASRHGKEKGRESGERSRAKDMGLSYREMGIYVEIGLSNLGIIVRSLDNYFVCCLYSGRASL